MLLKYFYLPLHLSYDWRSSFVNYFIKRKYVLFTGNYFPGSYAIWFVYNNYNTNKSYTLKMCHRFFSVTYVKKDNNKITEHRAIL